MDLQTAGIVVPISEAMVRVGMRSPDKLAAAWDELENIIMREDDEDLPYLHAIIDAFKAYAEHLDN